MIPLSTFEEFCNQNPEFELLCLESFPTPRGGFKTYTLAYKYPSIVNEHKYTYVGNYMGYEVYAYVLATVYTHQYGNPLDLSSVIVADSISVNIGFDDELHVNESIIVDSPDEFRNAVSKFKKNMTKFIMNLRKIDIKSSASEYEV